MKNTTRLLVIASALCLGLIGCSALPYKNNHLIISDSPPKKICVIGDTGTGKYKQKKIAEHMYKENCEVVFLVGDIIYPGGIKSSQDYQIQKKFFGPYKKFFKKDNPIPFYLVLGNHDYMGNEDAWINVAKKYPGQVIIPHHFYSGTWEDLCFAVVDTNTHNITANWRFKNHRQSQKEWLQKVNKKFKKNCKFKLAFGHHPYLSSGQHGSARPELKKFLDDYIIGQYDMYLAGHDHNLAYEGEVKKTSLVVSGAGAKLRPLRTKFKSKEKFNASKLGYVVLTTSRSSEGKSDLAIEFKYLENGKMKSGFKKILVK